MDSKLEGFCYYTNFISAEEGILLLKQMPTLDWQEIKMFNQTAKRRVIHLGLNYTYANRSVTPTTPPPAFLHPFIIRSATILKVEPQEIAEILITEYPVGAGIGWHRDAPVFDKILGVSLGSDCMIKFRIKRDEEYEIIKVGLSPNSAYLLSGVARSQWQHSIPPVKIKRYSITFRTLKNKFI